jgi:hypothetical protein
MYLGFSENGIREELECNWTCALICTKLKEPLLPLSNMETAVLKLGATIPNKANGDEVFDLFPGNCKPELASVARGILTFIERLYKRDHGKSPPNAAPRLEEAKPDRCFHFSEEEGEINPYGNTDFTCMICYQELSNSYFQCLGCWDLLSKDFNICVSCYDSKKFYRTHAVHAIGEGKGQDHGVHEGRMYRVHEGRKRTQQCACPHRLNCLICEKCPDHVCVCHNNFKHHYRFYKPNDLKKMIENCKSWCGNT